MSACWFTVQAATAAGTHVQVSPGTAGAQLPLLGPGAAGRSWICKQSSQDSDQLSYVKRQHGEQQISLLYHSPSPKKYLSNPFLHDLLKPSCVDLIC